MQDRASTLNDLKKARYLDRASTLNDLKKARYLELSAADGGELSAAACAGVATVD
ncbi:hypothetical protein DY000_02047065 [Brassica cretica]|uniref:Uncharacterized protein n=1 Tax=Brassica cretica TaxID=69181 RepID=A0ABQ7F1J1_BRACR|nr:hypothetical protein DY000_02047065 [Brassica cretica]